MLLVAFLFVTFSSTYGLNEMKMVVLLKNSQFTIGLFHKET